MFLRLRIRLEEIYGCIAAIHVNAAMHEYKHPVSYVVPRNVICLLRLSFILRRTRELDTTVFPTPTNSELFGLRDNAAMTHSQEHPRRREEASSISVSSCLSRLRGQALPRLPTFRKDLLKFSVQNGELCHSSIGLKSWSWCLGAVSVCTTHSGQSFFGPRIITVF